METSIKEQYECPVTEVVEVKAEGVICGSSGLDDYIVDDPKNW